MPSYNHGNYIGESIQSVINQDYTNWELIIIDNHSTDNTSQVIDTFEDSRIKFFSINNNGVIAKSRNLGITKAQGEWVAFLDSDDVFENRKLGTVFSEIKKRGDGVYFHTCHKIIFNKKSRRKIGYFRPSKNSMIDLLAKGNRIILSSLVVKRQHLDNIKFSEEKKLVTVEDFDLILNLLKKKLTLNFINKTIGGYRYLEDSLSRKKFHLLNVINLLEREKVNFNFKLSKRIDLYIVYCSIKGKFISPMSGYKSLLQFNFFSFVLIKSYLINTSNIFWRK